MNIPALLKNSKGQEFYFFLKKGRFFGKNVVKWNKVILKDGVF